MVHLFNFRSERLQPLSLGRLQRFQSYDIVSYLRRTPLKFRVALEKMPLISEQEALSPVLASRIAKIPDL